MHNVGKIVAIKLRDAEDIGRKEPALFSYSRLRSSDSCVKNTTEF
jgi:hypothetical protein